MWNPQYATLMDEDVERTAPGFKARTTTVEVLADIDIDEFVDADDAVLLQKVKEENQRLLGPATFDHTASSADVMTDEENATDSESEMNVQRFNHKTFATNIPSVDHRGSFHVEKSDSVKRPKFFFDFDSGSSSTDVNGILDEPEKLFDGIEEFGGGPKVLHELLKEFAAVEPSDAPQGNVIDPDSSQSHVGDLMSRASETSYMCKEDETAFEVDGADSIAFLMQEPNNENQESLKTTSVTELKAMFQNDDPDSRSTKGGSATPWLLPKSFTVSGENEDRITGLDEPRSHLRSPISPLPAENSGVSSLRQRFRKHTSSLTKLDDPPATIEAVRKAITDVSLESAKGLPKNRFARKRVCKNLKSPSMSMEVSGEPGITANISKSAESRFGAQRIDTKMSPVASPEAVLTFGFSDDGFDDDIEV